MTMPAQGTPDLLIFRVKPGACLDTPRLRSTRPVEYRPEFRLDMAATMRIGDERAGRRAVQHQLAERAHQEERDDADERVAHQQGRPGAVQPRRRTEEQAGTDRPADGDHLHLATVQTLFVALVLRIQRSGSRRRRAGLGLCHCNLPRRRSPGAFAGISPRDRVGIQYEPELRWLASWLPDKSRILVPIFTENKPRSDLGRNI